jgi:hypothetical protein
MLWWSSFQWSASFSCIKQYSTSLHLSTACEDQEWTYLPSSWWEQPLTCTWPSTQPPAEPWSRSHTASAKFDWSSHTYTRLEYLTVHNDDAFTRKWCNGRVLMWPVDSMQTYILTWLFWIVCKNWAHGKSCPSILSLHWSTKLLRLGPHECNTLCDIWQLWYTWKRVERRQSYLKLLWIQLPDVTKCVTTDVFCVLVGPQP